MVTLPVAQPSAADAPARQAPARVRDFYSISQAAALLGVSRVSVWRWIRAGHLPVSRLGHRTARIRHQDLDLFIVLRAAGGPAGTRPSAVEERSADAAAWDDLGTSEHLVQFYEADAYLLDAVSGFIGTALGAGDVGVVVATQAHREGVEDRLSTTGLDLETIRAEGRYLALDAAELLARFMRGGAPDAERFLEVVGGLVAQAASSGRQVRVFGEMVALLADEGDHAAALRLEELWNDLQRMHGFSLFCAYPMRDFSGEALGGPASAVCEAHSRVVPTERYMALAAANDRLRAVTLLQQKAQSLEAEVAERQRAEERLRLALAAERFAREAAETALRVRDEFLSIASHELRTPVAALSVQAQVMLRRLKRDGHVEPERFERALHAITGQSEKLSHLLSHLLDVARLEGGKLTLEPRPTDLSPLVEQVVSDTQSLSAGRAITLAAPPSVIAHVDPLRFEQVLTNLLSNATKYSPQGAPVEVTLARADEATVELSVRDRGPGIPPEKRERIFERFYQAHDNGHSSGLGLGLYICRQIVELHGGGIHAEGPSDGGTRLVVRLPIEPVAAPAPTQP